MCARRIKATYFVSTIPTRPSTLGGNTSTSFVPNLLVGSLSYANAIPVWQTKQMIPDRWPFSFLLQWYRRWFCSRYIAHPFHPVCAVDVTSLLPAPNPSQHEVRSTRGVHDVSWYSQDTVALLEVMLASPEWYTCTSLESFNDCKSPSQEG
jgi:hypothetical protein